MKILRAAAGNVLALDLATTTGHCVGAFGARPRFGAITLRGTEHVQRQAALREWLDAQDKFQRITAVVVEAALIGHFSSRDAEYLTIALHATLALWCYDVEVPLVPIAASTVRSAMLGTSKFKKGTAKRNVMEWCRLTGFSTRSDDAADAILTWHWAEADTLGYQRAAAGLLAPTRAA